MHLNFPCAPRFRSSRVFRRRLARGFATVGAVLALVWCAPRAHAVSESIFLYDSGGVPQNVTMSYYVSDHHLYDPLGNPVGTVDAGGYILDNNNHVLGYIVIN